MGGWKLEVFKKYNLFVIVPTIMIIVMMGVYMSFPVGLFYYFNQPQFFENWMMEKRNQLFPPQELNAKERINKTIDYLEKRREEQLKKDRAS